jgi:hypothetical protein
VARPSSSAGRAQSVREIVVLLSDVPYATLPR